MFSRVPSAVDPVSRTDVYRTTRPTPFSNRKLITLSSWIPYGLSNKKISQHVAQERNHLPNPSDF